MKFVVFVLFIAVAFAFTSRQGGFLCNMCTSLINTLESLLTTKGADKVKEYVDTLCDKVSGFVASLCTKILDFGVDKLIQLIENKVDPSAICAKLSAC